MSLEDLSFGSKRWMFWMDNHDRVLYGKSLDGPAETI